MKLDLMKKAQKTPEEFFKIDFENFRCNWYKKIP